MLTNCLKIAWRNLNKYRFISFVSLFGLTVGLTCCLLPNGNKALVSRGFSIFDCRFDV